MDPSYLHRIERARRQTPEQRFFDTLEMIDLSRELLQAGIRMQFPDADEEQVRRIMRERIQRLRTVNGA